MNLNGAVFENVEAMDVRDPLAVLMARRFVHGEAEGLGLKGVEATMLATAVSELARNVLEHGGGGVVTCHRVRQGWRSGLVVDFADEGSGIADISRALEDGFTTNRGMGVGLPGARRLVDEMDIDSVPGEGTRVRIAKWILHTSQ